MTKEIKTKNEMNKYPELTSEEWNLIVRLVDSDGLELHDWSTDDCCKLLEMAPKIRKIARLVKSQSEESRSTEKRPFTKSKLFEVLSRNKSARLMGLGHRVWASRRVLELHKWIREQLVGVIDGGYLLIEAQDADPPLKFDRCGPIMKLIFPQDRVDFWIANYTSTEIRLRINSRRTGRYLVYRNTHWTDERTDRQLTGEVLEEILLDVLFGKEAGNVQKNSSEGI
jgi:hypothetical protein